MSVGWWMQNKMWYIHKMEYYSAIKNEIMKFKGKWIGLESIILSNSGGKKSRILPNMGILSYKVLVYVYVKWEYSLKFKKKTNRR